MACSMVNQEPAEQPETKATTPTEARTRAQLRMRSATTTSWREELSDAEPSTISPPKAANRDNQGKHDGGARDRSPGRNTEEPLQAEAP
jgi:hypothetical protein